MDTPLFTVTINQGSDELMASLNEVKAAIADLQATAQTVEDGLDTVVTTVQQLRDQLAAGSVITEGDLDEVLAELAEVKTPLTDSLDKEAAVNSLPMPPIPPIAPIEPTPVEPAPV